MLHSLIQNDGILIFKSIPITNLKIWKDFVKRGLCFKTVYILFQINLIDHICLSVENFAKFKSFIDAKTIFLLERDHHWIILQQSPCS